MGDLCGSAAEQGRKRALRVADDLIRLADLYVKMAKGHIDPHTDAALPVGALGRAIVRDLVEDWV